MDSKDSLKSFERFLQEVVTLIIARYIKCQKFTIVEFIDYECRLTEDGSSYSFVPLSVPELIRT